MKKEYLSMNVYGGGGGEQQDAAVCQSEAEFDS